MSSTTTTTTTSTSSSGSPAAGGSVTNSVMDLALEKQQRIVDGEVDTTDTKARYLGLIGRIRPVLLPAARYLAYTR
jgi:hypothetical protein